MGCTSSKQQRRALPGEPEFAKQEQQRREKWAKAAAKRGNLDAMTPEQRMKAARARIRKAALEDSDALAQQRIGKQGRGDADGLADLGANVIDAADGADGGD